MADEREITEIMMMDYKELRIRYIKLIKNITTVQQEIQKLLSNIKDDRNYAVCLRRWLNLLKEVKT